MNGKQVKKIRQAIRRAQPDIVRMFDSLKAWPFRLRLKLAWELIKGVSRKDAKIAKGSI